MFDVNLVLAIDQGTTGSRAIVFDRNGRAVASAYEEFPQYFPRPGWVEHDPEDIWSSCHLPRETRLARRRSTCRSLSVSRTSARRR